MDRELTKQEKRREKQRKWLRIGSIVFGFVFIMGCLYHFIDSGIDGTGIRTGRAEQGVIESCITGTGKIVPLYEQTIVSPVTTRILEVYCNEGDHVVSGQSLLRLDLQTAQTDLQRKADEVSMRRNEIEQTALSSATYLTDIEMKIKTKEMAVNHLMEEVNNERRLDSIGSGTGDRIREAELAYSTGILELQQLKTQLANERKSHAASLRSKELEGSITERDLKEMERTIEDARVRAPRNGTVTYLNKGIGTSISQGEKLAVVSDLSHFKINGEIVESSANKLATGQKVNVRIGKETIPGHIASISPQSNAGVVNFIVLLEDDISSILRSGLKAELNVIYDLREDVIRIPNGSFFTGPGTYELFVKKEDKTYEKRSIDLGDSNFDYIEVKSGLQKDEEVVISDMSLYKKKNSIHIK